jgi:hypothetical protein
LLGGHLLTTLALLLLAWVLGSNAQGDAAKAVLLAAMQPGLSQVAFVPVLVWRVRRQGQKRAMGAILVGAASVLTANVLIDRLALG